MSNIDQQVDEIIHEENLEPGIAQDKEDQEDIQENKEENDNKEEKDGEKDSGDKQDSSESDDEGDSGDSKDGDNADEKEKKDKSDEDDDSKDDDEDEENLEEAVEKAKTVISQLEEGGVEVFGKDGKPKEFGEIVPAGAYFLSVLEPVKVTDKEGKTHEFLLLSDVEKKFPEGFEAKNNIEQLKFERAISKNEGKFEEAIGKYQEAEKAYKDEVDQRVQQSSSNQSIADEYKAMAKEGLVPEVGDPKDPNFKDSDAVKELDKILDWMNTKNEELKKKGLGSITSLYVAKQLMDSEDKKDDKKDQKDKIVEKRKEVARLNKSPDNGDKSEGKKKLPVNQPMSTYIEQLLADEDIK